MRSSLKRHRRRRVGARFTSHAETMAVQPPISRTLHHPIAEQDSTAPSAEEVADIKRFQPSDLDRHVCRQPAFSIHFDEWVAAGLEPADLAQRGEGGVGSSEEIAGLRLLFAVPGLRAPLCRWWTS